jgi:hypothetical protein
LAHTAERTAARAHTQEEEEEERTPDGNIAFFIHAKDVFFIVLVVACIGLLALTSAIGL